MNAATRGVIFIHSAPAPLRQHIEWAVSGVLGYKVHMDWTSQPAQPSMVRCEYAWRGAPGLGATLASALSGWEHLRFEVTEDATVMSEGGRWSSTPSLGIFYAQTDLAGNVVIPENRIRAAIEEAGDDVTALRERLDLALGTAWDRELEPFRYAGAGAPVRWLHRVG